ncbi:hypothetical protein HYS42_00710 [Candidatus Saccharibacteria bacterium]|nr:hypothetical protein [Candidatus Saccharibacteria bacterium]
MPSIYDQKNPERYFGRAPDRFGVEYDHLRLARDPGEEGALVPVTERTKTRRLLGIVALAAVIAVATVSLKEDNPQTVSPSIDTPPALMR